MELHDCWCWVVDETLKAIALMSDCAFITKYRNRFSPISSAFLALQYFCNTKIIFIHYIIPIFAPNNEKKYILYYEKEDF